MNNTVPLIQSSIMNSPAARSIAVRISPALLTFIILSFIACSPLLTPLRAQTSQATIRGKIHDPGTAVLVGATVRLVNIETGVTTTTATNADGDYLFQNLNPGTYSVEASYTGFSTEKVNTVTLVVNQTSNVDFSLHVGNVSSIVNVNATGAAIEASTSELSSTLEPKQLEELPLNGRNFTSLFVTAPGVSYITPSGSQVTRYTTSIGPASIPSFNGQTNRSDLFLMDGILDIETFGNAYAVQPIIDVIQDQRLQSHNDSAEFGGSTGGTVNLATKAGTNSLHGSAWEFNETGSLQALPYFTPAGTAQTSLSQNEFGGTFGGPIVIPHLYNGKDKTFFFLGYEGFRFSTPGSPVSMIVPTAAELSGDFSADAPIYDPATTTCDAAGVCSRSQFDFGGQLNHIDPARLNQGDIYYVQHAEPAITPGGPPGTNTFQAAPQTQSYNEYNARVDETITQKDSAFFRISGLRGPSTSGRTQLPTSIDTNGYQYVGSYYHVFSPSSAMHLQAGRTYLRKLNASDWQGLPADFNAQVGYPTGLTTGYLTLKSVTPGYSVDNAFSDAGTYAGPLTTADGWSIKGDYTYVLGRHTLKTGSEFNKIGELSDVEQANVHFRANETNSLVDGTSGDALASFLIGVPSDATKRNASETLGFGGVFSIYAQDQFQATSALTLNFGLRYDLGLVPKFGTPGANNQAVGNFDFNNGTYVVYKVPGSCASLNNAPCIPTPDGSLPPNVVASNDGKVLRNNNLNLQPRIGFAYRTTATTVVRGGFGISFDNYAGLVQNVRGVAGNWPSVGQIQQSGFNLPTAANPFPGVTPQAIPNLSALPAATPFGLQNWYIDPKAKDAYSLQWNLGVQHELNAATVVSATYVGSANRRLDVGGYYNVALTPGPGNPTLRQPYPYITPTFYSKSNGSGSYNALQLQLSRRFTKGLAATIAYTWSKSIDEGCSGFFGSEGCDVQQIYNIAAERSVSAFDVPQNFTATWNYELPIGRGKLVNLSNRALDAVVGGWQLNGIIGLYSGTPYSVHVANDIANIGSSQQYERPNIVGSSVPANRSVTNWLNPNGFATPAQYTYGDMGRNSLRTQFYQDYTMSLFKNIPIEHFNFQLRAEAFNLPNHKIFGQPNSTYGAQGFGAINSIANNPRAVQLGARMSF